MRVGKKNTDGRKPRVAHVLSPFIQPTETFIYDRITNHAGFEPFVLTDEPAVNLDGFPFSPIYSLASLSPLARKAQNAARRATGCLPFFLETLARERPAVIHAHYGTVGAALAPLKLKSGIPLVTSFYGIDASALLGRDRHRAAFARLWKHGDMVSALSEDMKMKLVRAGCPEEKIRVHHLAVDTGAMKPPDVRPPAPPVKIICASRLVEKKGVDTLLRATALARGQEEIEIDIAGTGPLEDRLRSLASELGLEGCARFHGYVPRERVLDLMRGAHIFALLSRTAADGDSEGTPTALMEAGALGLPCVSTRHAGIPEVVEHEAGGLLVNENDHQAAADALARLAADSGLRASMGEAARKKIEREFSIRSVMEQIENDYRSLRKN